MLESAREFKNDERTPDDDLSQRAQLLTRALADQSADPSKVSREGEDDYNQKNQAQSPTWPVTPP